jgi:beta-lactamase superfamily II metal-dependent hydrolase
MSYGVFFGLLCLGPPIGRFFAAIKFENRFSSLLAASLAAGAAVFPLTAYFYGSASLVAPLANFFAVPLTTVIVTMTGVFALFSWIPPVAALCAFIPQIAAMLLDFLNSLLARTDIGFVRVEGFAVWMGLALFAAIYILSDFFMAGKRYKAVLSAALAAMVIAGMAAAYGEANDCLARITVLDVGTGDAIHISTREGDYLIDNGGNPQYSNMTAYTEDNGIIYDAVIVSNDRTGNLEGIITGGLAETLQVPENYKPKDYDAQIPVMRYAIYDTIELGGDVVLEAAATDGKNYSFFVNCAGVDVCLLAQNDAETLAELRPSEAPVFKAGKGGSAAAVTPGLAALPQMEHTIISVRANDARGLPDGTALAALRDAGGQLYITAETGAVTITVKTDGAIRIETMK